jgi:hypothetical protein
LHLREAAIPKLESYSSFPNTAVRLMDCERAWEAQNRTPVFQGMIAAVLDLWRSEVIQEFHAPDELIPKVRQNQF